MDIIYKYRCLPRLCCHHFVQCVGRGRRKQGHRWVKLRKSHTSKMGFAADIIVIHVLHILKIKTSKIFVVVQAEPGSVSYPYLSRRHIELGSIRVLGGFSTVQEQSCSKN